ncbi:unnamed protein product [Victoria cruziana]
MKIRREFKQKMLAIGLQWSRREEGALQPAGQWRIRCKSNKQRAALEVEACWTNAHTLQISGRSAATPRMLLELAGCWLHTTNLQDNEALHMTLPRMTCR